MASSIASSHIGSRKVGAPRCCRGHRHAATLPKVTTPLTEAQVHFEGMRGGRGAAAHQTTSTGLLRKELESCDVRPLLRSYTLSVTLCPSCRH